MADIIELILAILAEIFVDVFGRVFIFFIPEEKFTPKLQKALSVVALVIAILFFAMLGFGISLLFTEGIHFVLGWIFIGVGVVYITTCVILNGIIKSKKKHK
ncbi:MAG: hypothetical protein IJY39_08895 [Clostridia bacterium]|nr:hypothetical protein [Clostridia bacterium]